MQFSLNLTLSAIVCLLSLIAYSILFVILLGKDFRNRLHQSFILYLLSMIFWSFGSFMIFADPNHTNTLFWNRFMIIGSAGMPIAFFYFVQVFLGRQRNLWVSVGVLSFIITQITNIMGILITDATVIDQSLHNTYGPAVVIPSVSWAFFVGFSAYELFTEHKRNKDVNYRNRLKYLLIVIFVIFAGNLTNTTMLTVFPVDIAFNVASALLISYAIFRHQLLDINLVVRKGLLYSVPTVIIGASYFLIISLIFRIFHAYTDTQIFFLSFIVAILSALLIQPFQSKAQSWLDRLFFREKYDSILMLQRISRTSAKVLDIRQLAMMILSEIQSTFHIKGGAFFLKEEDSGDYFLRVKLGTNALEEMKFRTDHPLVQQLIRYDRTLTMEEINVIPQFKALWEKEKNDIQMLGAELFIPVKVQGELVGIFALGAKLSEETYSTDDQITLTTMANQTAVAIQNARLYEIARQEVNDRKRAEERLHAQLKRINALHSIDIAITSSVSLQLTLQVLLDVIITQLQVDAAAVLLLDMHTQILEYTASRGFKTTALQHTRLNLGDGLAGMAALQQSIVHIPNLRKEITSLQKSPLLQEEEFISYYGVPLVAKGKIKGVLEIFHRTPHEPDADWMEFLETLATETAIAVDNAEMFNDMQRSNLELTQAYVTTLEGWSRALELRDRETEGHTQRVTDITLELARVLGMKPEELVHVRRGALLHDIGKMGIPDSILLKPGPLTAEEWEIMKQHPVYAFKLLSTIPFLRPALDIPYYHHEKWDGSGYPRRLKGDEIPLPARIFAVVDVWDALLSDRPYRAGLPIEQALAYIREQSGSHFDPAVVEAFLRLYAVKPSLLRRESVLELSTR